MNYIIEIGVSALIAVPAHVSGKGCESWYELAEGGGNDQGKIQNILWITV